MSRALLVLALVLALPAAARAASTAAATEAYAQQKYAEAAAAYEQVIAAGGGNELVHYNLGNAYYRAGQLGRAALAYERALRLNPDFDDARYNLDVVREAVAARLGKDTVKGAVGEPFWVRAVHAVPLTVLLVAVLLLDLFFFAALIALRFLPTGFLRTGVVVASVFAAVGAVGFGTLLAGRVWHEERVRTSIVVADEVVMRELPDAASREMPKLHAGLRVVVLRESPAGGGWWRIRLANAVEGWVPKATVEPL